MKKNVGKEFPYGLKQYTEENMKSNGLCIIQTIESTKIHYDSPKLAEFIKNIKEKCSDKHVLVLFGSNDTINWIPLQAASKTSENVAGEIRTDFLRMTPFDEKKDIVKWNSYFYNSVMEIKNGFDDKCQKYQKMKSMCKYLAVAILDNEELQCTDCESYTLSKYQMKECDIALDIEPLFWNPFGKERTYIESKFGESVNENEKNYETKIAEE